MENISNELIEHYKSDESQQLMNASLGDPNLTEQKRGQMETLVRQLVAFNHFLCQFHEDAKRTRDKIALSTDLQKARELAMFEYPVVQGIVFNMDIYEIGTMELEHKEGDIQEAVKYMLSLSNQSA